jgi:mycothiol synthase
VTLEAYQRLRATPSYRTNLDLVAVAPDGTLAAYCICWYDQATQIGLFEPVGTHPAYRRQGFGRAVVVEGLRRLQAAGAIVAWVTAVDSNEPAGRLYENVGFTAATDEYLYRKPL